MRVGAAARAHAINAGPEATVVTRLREAGCVIAGKTRLAEFAALAPPATANPHNSSYSPGGSSSGSAAAVAAGLRRRGARHADHRLDRSARGFLRRRGIRADAGARAARRRRALFSFHRCRRRVRADCNTLRDVSAHLRRLGGAGPRRRGPAAQACGPRDVPRCSVRPRPKVSCPRRSRACGTPASRARCVRCPRRCWTTSQASRSGTVLLGKFRA